MDHSIHIMLGKASEKALLQFKTYIKLYAPDELEEQIKCFLYSDDNEQVELIEALAPEQLRREAVCYMAESKSFSGAEKEGLLRDKLQALFDSYYRVGGASANSVFRFVIYLPTWEADKWEAVKKLLPILNLSNRVEVLVVALKSDLSKLFLDENKGKARDLAKQEKTMQELLKELIVYKDEKALVKNIVLLGNRNIDGLSLDFKFDTCLRVLADLAILFTQHHNSLFQGAELQEQSLTSIGISSLYLDRHYFINFLLQKAYCSLIESEGIAVDNRNRNFLNLQELANEADKRIRPKLAALTSFINREIQPRLQNGLDHSTIIAEVSPKLEALFQQMKQDFTDFVYEQGLSLQEKKLILSMILNRDTDLSQDLFQAPTVIDELEQEAMELFIQANNAVLMDEELKGNAILSLDDEPTYYPLQDIIRLRQEALTEARLIRSLEEDIAQLEQQAEEHSSAKKCLLEDGFFVYGEQRYRLLPDIVDEPLKEDYIPKTVSATSTDLREAFAPVRDQGQQGACLSFALTSLYEYNLYAGQGQDRPRFSEAFLYYNARKRAGKELEDFGTTLPNSIVALSQDGLCKAELFPYDESNFTAVPSQVAYEDGRTRLLAKALNVPLRLDAIKSALIDKYPVAISAKLYSSFGKGRAGFIPMPSKEELYDQDGQMKKHGNHAMVICGFSDEHKYFIVRNSWGSSFGDNGYCYLPYAYIEEGLISWATIVSKINLAEEISYRLTPRSFSFDMDNIDARIQILKNKRRETEKELQQKHYLLHKLENIHEELKVHLKDRLGRDRLEKSYKSLLNKFNRQTTEKMDQVNQDFKDFRQGYDKQTLKIYFIVLAIVAVCSLIIYGVFKTNFELMTKLKYYLSIGALATAPILISFLLVLPYRRYKKRQKGRAYKEDLTNLDIKLKERNKQLEKLDIDFYIRGQFLDKLFSLINIIETLFHKTEFLETNLTAWHKEIVLLENARSISLPVSYEHILKDERLKVYFEDYKEQILSGLVLSDYLKENSLLSSINEESISAVKKDVYEKVLKHLDNSLKDFSIYQYLSQQNTYPFLENDVQESKVLSRLQEDSKVFLAFKANNGAIVPAEFISLSTKNSVEETKWRGIYRNIFGGTPIDLKSLDKYTLFYLQTYPVSLNSIK